MQLILTILIYVVAIEHLGIMSLEMWGNSATQAKAFGMSLDFVRRPEAQVALANQGIYNGMLGLSLIIFQWLLAGHAQLVATAVLLLFIVIVAIYGSCTAKKEILWLQGMPALVTLLVLLTLIV
ncbi:DUF1304 domain-containing protein [Levilactobacillus tujiorum]|uniref:DUF1304 domain-containing protein n=1 Tax=Levilactobacillus tujiorum TaxID=2912243 RepID=A0ABX1L5R3_9LACO|nr:DUF1304 domain-containing protein [Levilactobacillus tujiorum]MCH5464667.1 DUF1304 domain-containing protein [Levilactobacillus tujiorum]NLR11853.1 DUF1304 domain-containing protein [Lactobacillus sp. HBUAS51387]NLR29646.1 DUF1304 domain-containing protein [Levilactobacillus tujiorum]NLR31040.1 DUF1304 domain-containing protein [Levilactobacillus tujiorum]